ncbi:MAG: FkbM family methyltransferase [Sediminibacterium sp.]
MSALKNIIRKWTQERLGFRRYLFIFSVFNIWRIRVLKNEKAFRYFTAMINREGAILDIGANIGITTVHLAKQHPGSAIYAFEPVPENYRTLEKMIAYYKLVNVQVFTTALGDTTGVIKMIMPKMAGSRMQGLSHVNEMENDEEIGNRYSVPLQKLDDIPDLQQVQAISAIKIDVENFEYYVLKGAEALIKKHKPIVFCELWNNERRELCFDYMKGLGYRIKVFKKNQLINHTNQDALNYFFLP